MFDPLSFIVVGMVGAQARQAGRTCYSPSWKSRVLTMTILIIMRRALDGRNAHVERIDQFD
jgi:hypothetical protein